MLPTALVTNLAAPVAPEFWDPSRGMVVDGADLRFDFGRGGLGCGIAWQRRRFGLGSEQSCGLAYQQTTKDKWW